MRRRPALLGAVAVVAGLWLVAEWRRATAHDSVPRSIAVRGSLSAATRSGDADRGIATCPPCEVATWRINRLTGGRNGLEDHYGFAVLGADGRLFFATMNANRPLFAGDLSSQARTTSYRCVMAHSSLRRGSEAGKRSDIRCTSSGPMASG